MYICFRIHHFDDEPYTSLSPVALAAATTAGTVSTGLPGVVVDTKVGSTRTKALFETFMTTFGKIYLDPSENATRFTIFSENVMRVAAMNAPIPLTFSVLTPWADMTPEEYSKMHGLITSETSPVGSDPGLPCQFAGKGKVPMLTPTAVPHRSLDYVALGATVPVKNQGKCGSCWAHGTTAVVESRMKLETGNITSLSEQYLMDCDPARVCQGCCGGLPERAIQWLAGDSGGLPREGQGIASEADYPYVSGSGTDPSAGHCNSSPCRKAQGLRCPG